MICELTLLFLASLVAGTAADTVCYCYAEIDSNPRVSWEFPTNSSNCAGCQVMGTATQLGCSNASSTAVTADLFGVSAGSACSTSLTPWVDTFKGVAECNQTTCCCPDTFVVHAATATLFNVTTTFAGKCANNANATEWSGAVAVKHLGETFVALADNVNWPYAGHTILRSSDGLLITGNERCGVIVKVASGSTVTIVIVVVVVVLLLAGAVGFFVYRRRRGGYSPLGK